MSLPEWLRCNLVTTPNAGEDARTLDHSSVAGGSVRWPLQKVVWRFWEYKTCNCRATLQVHAWVFIPEK